MIGSGELVSRVRGLGVTVVAGVPCSYLTPVIDRAISDPAVRYVRVTQEGEAVALAAGAWLGGGLGCAITQNSGLGNMVNPITSLLHAARIPALLVVTWRGRPGEPDEPQHRLMGAITRDLLTLIGVEHELLTADPRLLAEAFNRARASLKRRSLPWAFVLEQGTVSGGDLREPEPVRPTARLHHHGRAAPRPPSRVAALERLLATIPGEAAVVSATGKTSRELFTIGDRPQHFYLVGAMGSAATVGLGLALHTSRPVVVVDGDGAVLMRLGGLASVAAAAPPGLVHVVLDNGVHDSTGGQRTLSATVDLPAVAAACGYAEVHACADLDDLEAATRAALRGGGPSLLHLRTATGSVPGLGRPTVTPAEVARRFRAFVTSPPATSPREGTPGTPAPGLDAAVAP